VAKARAIRPTATPSSGFERTNIEERQIASRYTSGKRALGPADHAKSHGARLLAKEAPEYRPRVYHAWMDNDAVDVGVL
jgi:hypothetical protein